ncbi:MAG: hypothetical protein JSW27_03985, partial [Phycisphaerales bacterium]
LGPLLSVLRRTNICLCDPTRSHCLSAVRERTRLSGAARTTTDIHLALIHSHPGMKQSRCAFSMVQTCILPNPGQRVYCGDYVFRAESPCLRT